jgi:hypothetical protein
MQNSHLLLLLLLLWGYPLLLLLLLSWHVSWGCHLVWTSHFV